VGRFLSRIVGAALLDRATYEDVESDPRASIQAAGVILFSSLATGIGAQGAATSVAALGSISLLALATWAVWALLTFVIGTQLLPSAGTRGGAGELLRTIGFAAAPGILRVLGVIPFITVPLFAITTLWMLAAMIVAVRQALDYTSTARAVAVCAVGWALTAGMVLGIGIFWAPALY
jgi:hypothetical protein